MLLWPLFYVSFFWLNFLLAPTLRYQRSFGSYALMFGGLLFFYRWPTWIRNTGWFGTAHRVVYAPQNIDISVPSFFLQEWNASIVAVCILELLLGWSNYFVKWRKELSVVRKTKRLDNNQIYILMQSLSRQFIHWQVCSVLLACAFVPYTFLFWKYISEYEDIRYLPHALIIHVLWAWCWLAVSLPLMQTGMIGH